MMCMNNVPGWNIPGHSWIMGGRTGVLSKTLKVKRFFVSG